MNRYYFTFGTSRKFPFRGGWVEVVAPDRKTAVRVFRSKYPDVNEGVVNCSDIYTADQFSKTGMVDGNLGAGCHDILLCQEVGACTSSAMSKATSRFSSMESSSFPQIP